MAAVTKESLAEDLKKFEDRVVAAEKKVTELETEKANWISNPTYGSRSTFDEQRALKAFGCSSPAQLIKVNTGAPIFKHVAPELKSVVKNLKTTVDVSRWIAQWKGQPLDRIGRTEDQDFEASVKGIPDSYYAKNTLVPMVKAFGTGVSGGGLEWIPTAISSNFIAEYELEFVLQQRFRSVTMPTNPWKQPVKKDVNKARKATENTSMTANSWGTTTIDFNAVKLASYQEIPEELQEDSAPDFLAGAKEEVILEQYRAVEAAAINGDDDGTHIDSDTQALGADVAEKVWKGLRRQSIANSANGSTVDFGAAFTKALLRTMRARMKKFGVNPANLMWICGPAVYTQFLALDEIMTVDKVGPAAATVLKGATAAYMGIPLIQSQYMREDLNATAGVYDGLVTNKAGLILVNTSRWYFGQRRAIQVKMMQDLPKDDRTLLASYQRLDFEGHVQNANEVSVVYGFNIPL